VVAALGREIRVGLAADEGERLAGPGGRGLAMAHRDGETVYGHTGGVSGFLSYNTFAPRTRSAVVLLVNGDDVVARPIHRQIMNLLTKDDEHVPKIDGPPPREMALELFHQLQQNRIDRTRLGEEYDAFLTPERAASAALHLAPLGEPDAVEVESANERGGMEGCVIRFRFPGRAISASLYRTPDGKVQQFLISP